MSELQSTVPRGTLSDARELTIKVSQCPGRYRRVSPEDSWHLVPFELFQVSVCREFEGDQQELLKVRHSLGNFSLLDGAVRATDAKFRESWFRNVTEEQLQAYLSALISDHSAQRSLPLKAFFSGFRLFRAVLSPSCCCGGPVTRDMSCGIKNSSMTLLTRSHAAFRDFHQWVRVWKLPLEPRKHLVSMKMQQDQRWSRSGARDSQRETIDEVLRVLENQLDKVMSQEVARQELLQLGELSQKLQALRDQIQLDLDASATGDGKRLRGFRDEDFGPALLVRCDIDSFAQRERRRYSEELDAVRVLEIRAAHEVFSRIMEQILKDISENAQVTRRLTDEARQVLDDTLYPVGPSYMESSRQRARSMTEALEKAKANFLVAQEGPSIGRAPLVCDLFKEEFSETEKKHAEVLSRAESLQAEALTLLHSKETIRRTAIAASSTWKSTEDIHQSRRSFFAEVVPRQAVRAIAEAAAERHDALNHKYQTEVVKALDLDKRRAQSLWQLVSTKIDAVSELGEQLCNEAKVRASLEAVLRDHTAKREADIRSFEQEVAAAQQEIQGRLSVLDGNVTETILPTKERCKELSKTYGEHQGLLYDIKRKCRLGNSAEESAESIAKDIAREHNSDTPELKHLCMAYDKIAQECKENAKELLGHSCFSEERQVQAQKDLDSIKDLAKKLREQLEKYTTWTGRTGIWEDKGEQLEGVNDPAVTEAKKALDHMRRNLDMLLTGLETAQAQVEELIATLCTRVSEEDNLRGVAAKDLFKQLCDKQADALEARSAAGFESVAFDCRNERLERERQKNEEQIQSLREEHKVLLMELKEELERTQREKVAKGQKEEAELMKQVQLKHLQRSRTRPMYP